MGVTNGKFKVKAGDKKVKVEKGKVKTATKPDKKKSKTKPAASVAVDTSKHIPLSATSAISFELVEEDGKKFIAARKFYCTKADPTFRPARGGFNMDADPKALLAIASCLKKLASNLDS